jgi:hypothetical protein
MHEQALASGVALLTRVYHTGDAYTKRLIRYRHYCHHLHPYSRRVVYGEEAEWLYAEILAKFTTYVVDADQI